MIFCRVFAVVLPKSVHEEYIVENSQIFSFALSDEDMATLKSLDQGHHFCWSAEDVMWCMATIGDQSQLEA